MSWSVGVGLIVVNYYGLPTIGQLPFSFLVLLLIAVPAVVSILQDGGYVASSLWIVLLSVSLRLIPAISEGGAAFMINPDSIYQYQLADIYAEHGAWIWGLETERAHNLVFFPILQILSVQISAVTGFPLFQVCRFLPVLFSVVTVMVVLSAFKLMLGGRIALVAAFLFSVCYKYNWFDGIYIQESLGILLFAMAFYSVMRATFARGRSGPLIFMLSSLVLVMTHFFSSLMLSIMLVLCYCQLFLNRRIPSDSLGLRSRTTLMLLVAFSLWLAFLGINTLLVGIRNRLLICAAAICH